MSHDNPNVVFDAGPADSELATHPVNKITWALAGRVTAPGRYMFRFGWLTVAPSDLAILDQFPNAIFALVKTAPTNASAGDDTDDEFHLGAFEVQRDRLP